MMKKLWLWLQVDIHLERLTAQLQKQPEGASEGADSLRREQTAVKAGLIAVGSRLAKST